MRFGNTKGLALGWLLAQATTVGCNPLVKLDVDCPKLCLTVPGPSLPGIPIILPPDLDGAILEIPDAGIPSVSGTWEVVMKFNEVLRQFPSAAVNLSANVQLTSINLTSTTDLSFIDSVDVFLSHSRAKADAGQAARSPEIDAGEVDATPPVAPSCKIPGSLLPVAYFRSPAAGASGASLSLIAVDPSLNLFDCMKDDPAKFTVKMSFRPDAYPATDVPLALGTCIGVQVHAGYP